MVPVLQQMSGKLSNANIQVQKHVYTVRDIIPTGLFNLCIHTPSRTSLKLSRIVRLEESLLISVRPCSGNNKRERLIKSLDLRQNNLYRRASNWNYYHKQLGWLQKKMTNLTTSRVLQSGIKHINGNFFNHVVLSLNCCLFGNSVLMLFFMSTTVARQKPLISTSVTNSRGL